MDLLTTVMHEQGHVLGLPDNPSPAVREDLLYLYLTPGERRLPDGTDVALAHEAALPASAQASPSASVVVGTPGKDTIDAGHGGSILFGGRGADSFVFGPDIQLHGPTPSPLTHVADYSAKQGDTFDFSALTSEFHGPAAHQGPLVRALEDPSGTFATLQVQTGEPHAPGSGPHWASVAQLDGAHAGDAVNVVVDGHAGLHLAHIHVHLLT